MSNSLPRLQLDFDLKDIPWLFHAFTIAHSTARLNFTNESKTVGKHIKSYVEKIKEFNPVLASYSLNEYEFFKACGLLATCKQWMLYQKKPSYTYQLEHWWKPIIFVADETHVHLTSTTQNWSPKLVADLLFC